MKSSLHRLIPLLPFLLNYTLSILCRNCQIFSLIFAELNFRLTAHLALRNSTNSSQSQSYVTTDGQSASLFWCQEPFGANDQIFITVRQLRVCCCGALSLTRERVCRLQLLLVLASAVILGSESRRTHDHILLSVVSLQYV
jgi:hypothetical protein